jgi:hypothetical protein
MDLNPDQMIAAGKLLPSSLVARLFDLLNRLTIGRAARVVVLDRFMAARLNAKRPAHDKLRVIPPWPHVASDELDPARVAAFRATNGLEDKFVVMYSGNHAIQHPLGTLLAAAARLANDDRICFVFIGGGAGKAAVEEQIAHGCRNIVSLPFLPLENVGESLPAADVHVVTMGNEVVGIVHPCKIYGAMAVGRPVLFFGPDQSHGGDLLRCGGIGWRIDHGDVDAAVGAIRQAAAMAAEDLRVMGQRASMVIADSLSRASLCGEFCDMVGNAGSRYCHRH